MQFTTIFTIIIANIVKIWNYIFEDKCFNKSICSFYQYKIY